MDDNMTCGYFISINIHKKLGVTTFSVGVVFTVTYNGSGGVAIHGN